MLRTKLFLLSILSVPLMYSSLAQAKVKLAIERIKAPTPFLFEKTVMPVSFVYPRKSLAVARTSYQRQVNTPAIAGEDPTRFFAVV